MNIWRNYRLFVPVIAVCGVLSGCSDIHRGDWVQTDGWAQDADAAGPRDVYQTEDSADPDVAGQDIPDTTIDVARGDISDSDTNVDAVDVDLPDVTVDVAQDTEEADDADVETVECPDVVCEGRECGPDPVCGISCGECAGSDACVDGQCVWQAGEYTVNCSTDGMCFVPAGPFWMGCNQTVDSECQVEESPYHEVTLSGYYIDRTEVTQGDYSDCVDAYRCEAPIPCQSSPDGTMELPVACIDWNNAMRYCDWVGKRLPTEAEWEKAARGTDGRKYPWGNETATCNHAVMDEGINGCGPWGAMDVCTKSPIGDSPYGLCDMAGNVWEWVSDRWDSEYYTDSPALNPSGPLSGKDRVWRGGSYCFQCDAYLRTSSRVGADPAIGYSPGVGFRCARSEVSPENCDGIDNNNDGLTDEDFTFRDWDDSVKAVGEPCGTGACYGGHVRCSSDKWFAECDTLGLASIELLNRIDDDCDGVTDEDYCTQNCTGMECGLDSVCGASCGSCRDWYGCVQGNCVPTVPMAFIPAGPFWMGCNEPVDTECDEDEMPYHQVTLPAYFMDITEVTKAEYKKCVNAGECDEPYEWDPTVATDRPVAYVNWRQAREYCAWAGKRLPTEAEWEKAARGTDGRKYPWGNETATCEYAVMFDGAANGCGTGGVMDVCSKSPAGDSPYGLCDMVGNISEWVSDWYDSDYYASSPASYPMGPTHGSFRVLRGASFYGPESLRASDRSRVDPSYFHDAVGIRCASDVPAEICDGADNDVDGLTDEDFSTVDWDDAVRAVGESCGTGACDGGHVECSLDGSYADCDTSHLASIELLNGTDDDCNGLIDDDYCTPDCTGLECGPDPVCGTCGSCEAGDGCILGECFSTVPMILIPAGSFWMGCNEAVDTQCLDNEKPYHEVTLSGYFMDKTEVTCGEYKKCVDAGVCDEPKCLWNPSVYLNSPVVCVNWAQAGEYCAWAGKRLPTEAEWEKAARGTDGRKYPWGNETATCEYAVMYDSSVGGEGCGLGRRWDVCSKSPAGDSPYGLCDMAGNVEEWVSDWYDSEYYTNSPLSNPTGADSGSARVLRGGNYLNYDYNIRASKRFDYHDLSGSVGNFGFRCARSQ